MNLIKMGEMYDTNEIIQKTEIDPQMYKTSCWLPKGKGWNEG